MKKILHIIATPRGQESRTLTVSRVFLDRLQESLGELAVYELDLFKEELPPLDVVRVGGKYVLMGGGELSGDVKQQWECVERQIHRFLDADLYLISTPMWNFSIPYVLKHYIDLIIQPKYLFRYTQKGPAGLVKGKKMVVVTSRGGDYGPQSPFHALDLQEPYLKTVFGFVGITDLTFIHAQPLDAGGPDLEAEKIKNAQNEAKAAADKI